MAYCLTYPLSNQPSMYKLVIVASISTGKTVEFNQSKLQFIEGVQKFNGYNGFTEKQGAPFQMEIYWHDKNSMDMFMGADIYRVFHGAIVTLSDRNSVLKLNNTIKIDV